MKLEQIIKSNIRELFLNEARGQEPIDDYVDGKRIYDMAPEIHNVVKELARPVYGRRLQKENINNYTHFFRKNSNFFDKIAKKYIKIKIKEGKGTYEINHIKRLLHVYPEYIIRSSHNPNNQLEGAEQFLKHFPEEIKLWDEKQKEEVEEFTDKYGSSTFNFLSALMNNQDFDLIDIISNIDFIFELQQKYNLVLLNLSIF